jgi:competence protein ComEA
MKSWQYTLLVLFTGMIASAVLFLVTSPPRGTSVVLLPAPSPAPIMVQVDGAVQNPGVYSLPRDSRIQQAIQAAGGFNPKANPGAVNQAAKLKDGDRLTVPAEGTQVTPLQPAVEPTARKEKSASLATPAALVNINTATLEELETLPGIGATRAQDILDYRQAHGGFKTIEDLQEVTGIGPATFEKIKPFITID